MDSIAEEFKWVAESYGLTASNEEHLEIFAAIEAHARVVSKSLAEISDALGVLNLHLNERP